VAWLPTASIADGWSLSSTSGARSCCWCSSRFIVSNNGQHLLGPRRALPARHGRDLRRLGEQHAAAQSRRARRDLGIANARMQGAFLLTNQLVAPPIGAALFAAGMFLPFAANAAAFALGALLISRIVGSMRSERSRWPACGPTWPRGSAGSSAIRPMRTLALTIFAFNVTFGAAWGVLVLYAGERWAWARSASVC
jgi:hypothetical protein